MKNNRIKTRGKMNVVESPRARTTEEAPEDRASGLSLSSSGSDVAATTTPGDGGDAARANSAIFHTEQPAARRAAKARNVVAVVQQPASALARSPLAAYDSHTRASGHVQRALLAESAAAAASASAAPSGASGQESLRRRVMAPDRGGERRAAGGDDYLLSPTEVVPGQSKRSQAKKIDPNSIPESDLYIDADKPRRATQILADGDVQQVNTQIGMFNFLYLEIGLILQILCGCCYLLIIGVVVYYAVFVIEWIEKET